MWGRATLTMVESRTTINWAVRMTKRNTVGCVRRPEGRLELGFSAAFDRDSRMASEGMKFVLSAGTVGLSGSFLRLLYGECLRFARSDFDFWRGGRNDGWATATSDRRRVARVSRDGCRWSADAG